MTETFDAGEFTLRKVRDLVWELPREGDMRVPARVLASEALLEEIREDDTLRQIRNTTHLPGIARHAVCMPDGHQGYGFPVGGVGAMDAEEGCISPGAVGYDINCLSGETEVTLEFGRRRRIDALAEDFEAERAVVAAESDEPADITLFTETADRTVYEVETAEGDTVVATEDHPLVTPDGKVELSELDPGDDVLVHPFEGLPDEEPEQFTVLDESDFADESAQLVGVLQDRDLLPLHSTDDAFQHLLKLVGFHTGDGAFSEKSGHTWFYADPADLEQIRSDIRAVGFRPSRIYERERTHEIGGKTFERTEYSARGSSKAFMRLLQKLGAPRGETVDSDFALPSYFDRLTDWQRGLYLSALFGAEMGAPAALSDTNLYAPTLSHNRRAKHADAGESFVRGIADALESMGIETNAIEQFEAETTSDAGTERFRLGINTDSENLVRFFTTVGYRYAVEKRRQAAVAVQYLKRTRRVKRDRADAAERARSLADGGLSPAEVKTDLDGGNERFVERSLWSGREGEPRPPEAFPSFESFVENSTVHGDGVVETSIEAIRERGTETVYDIGVDHEDHTFLANGFVVSNCGVRMVRTDLDYGDVRGREEDLVEALFEAVPSGLGGGGVVQADAREMDAILERGVDWAVEQGYAVEGDRLACEDEGHRPEADAAKISQEAKDRGRNQVGSLGSGNHFLEVQRVTDVYRDDVAEAYGLRENQVVVLIHCGSRGLGHQTCNDYLRDIEQAHAGLLERLPDRELAAAPAGSPLAADYYGAMCACINFAWVNRQLVTHAVRGAFEDVFDAAWEELGMDLLYDVAHNIAKREVHEVPVGPDGLPSTDADAVDHADRELFVHRKGATRAFPAGRPEVPAAYRSVGQPVIIPGSMGAGSYVLRGGEESMAETFGSTAHGAGRLMSRTQAKQEFWGGDVQDDLRDQQVYVKAESGATIAEEAPGVYKDVDEVVRVSETLGIGDRVARTFPVCNVKG